VGGRRHVVRHLHDVMWWRRMHHAAWRDKIGAKVVRHHVLNGPIHYGSHTCPVAIKNYMDTPGSITTRP